MKFWLPLPGLLASLLVAVTVFGVNLTDDQQIAILGLVAALIALLGDGEIAEGSVWEAASLAGTYKLNNLIAIVDVKKRSLSEGE